MHAVLINYGAAKRASLDYYTAYSSFVDICFGYLFRSLGTENQFELSLIENESNFLCVDKISRGFAAGL